MNETETIKMWNDVRDEVLSVIGGSAPPMVCDGTLPKLRASGSYMRGRPGLMRLSPQITSVHAARIVFTHELTHYLLNQVGFPRHGHSEFFLALHKWINDQMHVHLGWPQYETSPLLSDREQCLRWEYDRACDILENVKSPTDSLDAAQQIADQAGLGDRMIAPIFTDARNGFRQFKAIAISVVSVGFSAWAGQWLFMLVGAMVALSVS